MLKKFFNYAAGKPSCQYTLGGDHNSFQFNRAARFVERVVSVPSLVVGGAIALFGLPATIAAAPVGVSMLTLGLAVAAFGKVAGLVKGGITHLVAAGANGLVNHMSERNAPQHR